MPKPPGNRGIPLFRGHDFGTQNSNKVAAQAFSSERLFRAIGIGVPPAFQQEEMVPGLDFTQDLEEATDAITLGRRHSWLESDGFSLSAANADVQELPATCTIELQPLSLTPLKMRKVELVAYSHPTYADAFGEVPVVGQSDLAHILALADYEPLFNRLRQYNRTGRPPFPVEAMWRTALTKYLLGLRYYAELVDLLRTNHAVQHLCGFEEGVPNTSAVCRFFKRLTSHLDLVEQAIDRLVNNVAQAVRERKDPSAPPVGMALAIDSTDIPAWVDTQKKPYSDPNAMWGHRTNPDAPDGSEFFYGYKLHLVCDAIYGTPLSYEILPANRNDSPTLPGLVDKVSACHPNFKPRYMIADKGYDALSNYRHLDQQGIVPVIPLRNTDKEGLYYQKGRPQCFGGKPMEYVGIHIRERASVPLPPEGLQAQG